MSRYAPLRTTNHHDEEEEDQGLQDAFYDEIDDFKLQGLTPTELKQRSTTTRVLPVVAFPVVNQKEDDDDDDESEPIWVENVAIDASSAASLQEDCEQRGNRLLRGTTSSSHHSRSTNPNIIFSSQHNNNRPRWVENVVIDASAAGQQEDCEHGNCLGQNPNGRDPLLGTSSHHIRSTDPNISSQHNNKPPRRPWYQIILVGGIYANVCVLSVILVCMALGRLALGNDTTTTTTIIMMNTPAPTLAPSSSSSSTSTLSPTLQSTYPSTTAVIESTQSPTHYYSASTGSPTTTVPTLSRRDDNSTNLTISTTTTTIPSTNVTWRRMGQDLDGGQQDLGFGSAVAMSATGQVIAVGGRETHSQGGGYRSGCVVVYQLSNDEWRYHQWQQIGNQINGQAAGNFLGDAVALSADGGILAAGGTGSDTHGNRSGLVRVLEYNTDTNMWDPLGQTLYGKAANERFGSSVALSADGMILAAGGYRHVRLYQYNATANLWDPLGQELATTGSSVALAADGTIVAAGDASRTHNATDDHVGRVRIFQYSNDEWQQLGSDVEGDAADDCFGISVDISNDGSIVATGASGYIRIHKYNSDTDQWEQLGHDLDEATVGDKLGRSVALSASGDIVAAGGPLSDGNGENAGHVCIFQYHNETDTWYPLGQDLKGEAANDKFGVAVALSSDGRSVAAGGHYSDGLIDRTDAGHVRVYELSE